MTPVTAFACDSIGVMNPNGAVFTPIRCAQQGDTGVQPAARDDGSSGIAGSGWQVDSHAAAAISPPASRLEHWPYAHDLFIER
jgi:hypothetical protein